MSQQQQTLSMALATDRPLHIGRAEEKPLQPCQSTQLDQAAEPFLKSQSETKLLINAWQVLNSPV